MQYSTRTIGQIFQLRNIQREQLRQVSQQCDISNWNNWARFSSKCEIFSGNNWVRFPSLCNISNRKLFGQISQHEISDGNNQVSAASSHRNMGARFQDAHEISNRNILFRFSSMCQSVILCLAGVKSARNCWARSPSMCRQPLYCFSSCKYYAYILGLSKRSVQIYKLCLLTLDN